MKIFSWLRSFFGMVLFVSLTALFSVLAILEAFTTNSRKIQDWIAKSWGLWTCHFFGVKLRAHGLGNIPNEGCIFLFNHTSFFDIFTVQGLVPHLRFGAKIELFKIPIFAIAMKRLGALPIARDRRQEVFKIYEEAKIRFAKGDQFALAPEGTRNDIEKLKNFKSGPFVFAINGQVPVVPVIIKGAHAVMPKGRILPNFDRWQREIHVTFLPAIATAGLTIENKTDLQQRVYQELQSFFR